MSSGLKGSTLSKISNASNYIGVWPGGLGCRVGVLGNLNREPHRISVWGFRIVDTRGFARAAEGVGSLYVAPRLVFLKST